MSNTVNINVSEAYDVLYQLWKSFHGGRNDHVVVLRISMQQNVLFVIQLGADGAVSRYYLRGHMFIGRNVSEGKPAITIASPIMSRTHGEFLFVDGQVLYRDLGSSNGVYINGVHYGFEGEEKEKILNDGDVLKIDTTDSPVLHPDAVLIIYRNAVRDISQWQALDLTKSPSVISIGRNMQKANIYINDDRISRSHASFSRVQNGWVIRDHDSANGVCLNGRRIEKTEALKGLDYVQILDYMFIYLGNALLIGKTANLRADLKKEDALDRQPAGTGKDLHIHIRKRTARQGLQTLTLLKDISLTIHSGELVLVLGGSGAGKTTFMNAVMGYEKADGTVCYGDTDIYSQYNRMKYEIGFVPQDTLLRENDSVYDTLYNAAQMKLPAGAAARQLRERVEATLQMVNLQHVSKSLIKSVSGGEKKRVSVGVELVSDPGLFFLDEPDSGLDAQSAIELMENLRAIANAGKIVMVISHAPDRAASSFDKVIVLAKSSVDKSGHLAFFGSVPQAYDFFETDSLEGVVGKINGRDAAGDRYIERWERRSHGTG